ncbi:MAG TPA: hypothetical protein VMA73_00030 [Streptosporangiaceae bacterium]|nr:hypothetical protein [Streptosporangiaceae bacterium]
MTGRITTRIAAALAAAIVIAGAGLGAASASASPLPAHGASASPIRAETDNGTTWTLYPGQLGASTGTQAGYADAGEVVSLGSVASFNGITAKGSANLAENIWIADGSEATVPGTHQLSSAANFSYGFQQAGDTYYMDSGPYAGQTLTLAQVKADFAGHDLLAWVGIESSGTADNGYILSVNGQPVPAVLGIVPSGGKVTAFAF